jgi:hypothetical protein
MAVEAKRVTVQVLNILNSDSVYADVLSAASALGS